MRAAFGPVHMHACVQSGGLCMLLAFAGWMLQAARRCRPGV